MIHILNSSNYQKAAISGRYLLLTVIFLAGISGHLQAQHIPSPGSSEAIEDSVALQQYVRQALDNSPRVEALFQQYYARLEQIPQAGALPDPEIMLQYHINPVEQSSPLSRTTVSATQMFPWFGTLGKRQEYVEQLAEAEWAAFEEARNNLVLEVKQQWYRMHELHHHLMVFQSNLELLNRLERQTESLYESGRVSQVDLLRIQIEQEELQTRMVDGKDRLEAMGSRFNAVLGREPDAGINMPAVMYSRELAASEAELRQVIQDRNPRLRERQLQEQAALTAVEQARLDGRPSFGLGVMLMNENYMYMTMMEGGGPAWTASLTLRLPLFRSKFKAQQQEARLNARAAREEQQDISNRLTAEAESLLQQYRDARRSIALHEERLIPKTRQALKVALAGYRSGRVAFEQIIQLQQQLLDYEMLLNSAYVKQNRLTAEIESLTGAYNISPGEIEPES